MLHAEFALLIQRNILSAPKLAEPVPAIPVSRIVTKQKALWSRNMKADLHTCAAAQLSLFTSEHGLEENVAE